MDSIDIEGLKQVIPSSLDDIIRKHRDELTLRLSSAADIAELSPLISMMGEQKQIRATINDWRIVCLDIKSHGKRLILTGINEQAESVWTTSFLKSFDYKNNLVLTENSIYRLGTKGEGEPTFHMLLHLCYLFHNWGIGETFGVPEIFY